MVYFQCEKCIETLKKKQVENHYLHVCKNAYQFRCLTCQQIFDRETIKAHTSCVSEDEKYKKGDNMTKPKNFKVQEKTIIKIDINNLKWSGFRKTSKKILRSNANYKLSIEELMDKLSLVYANSKNTTPDNVDRILLKKELLRKLEDDSRFVIDLGKNTIRYKD